MSTKNKAKVLKTGIKKPRFVRIGLKRSHGRLDEKWRVPGIHSHFRRKTASPHKRPNIGYKQPEKLRGLHPSGLQPVWIHNLKELEGVDPKTQGIYVAAQVGARLKTKIVEEAKKRKIRIFNPRINRKVKKKKVKKEEVKEKTKVKEKETKKSEVENNKTKKSDENKSAEIKEEEKGEKTRKEQTKKERESKEQKKEKATKKTNKKSV